MIKKDIHKDSFFELHLKNGDYLHERNHSWHKMSREKRVKYMGGFRIVKVLNHKADKVSLTHNFLKTSISVPDDCEVYIATGCVDSFTKEGAKHTEIVAKYVGLIKDDEIIEERLLDIATGCVAGFKK